MPIRDRSRPLWPERDVPSRRHAVLGGISPGYPSVTARLHTCYSPVRRSPAGESKLPPPLPLDLHVLSLSLAFILSQDQTLRCCYLVSFSFQNQRRPRRAFVDPTRVWRIDKVLLFSSCTTLNVYCKSFNVLVRIDFRCGVAEKLCKVTDNFSNHQIFLELFFQVFSAAGSRPRPCLSGFQSCGNPGLSSRRDLRPKSECKVRHFLPFHQIFQQEFYAKKHSFTKYPPQSPMYQ